MGTPLGSKALSMYHLPTWTLWSIFLLDEPIAIIFVVEAILPEIDDKLRSII